MRNSAACFLLINLMISARIHVQAQTALLLPYSFVLPLEQYSLQLHSNLINIIFHYIPKGAKRFRGAGGRGGTARRENGGGAAEIYRGRKRACPDATQGAGRNAKQAGI